MVLIFIYLYFSIRYSHSEEWTIHVYTGTERFAGTDSNIFIRLFTSKDGYTPECQLTHENWVIGEKELALKNLFEYGEHDRFRISTERLGSIEKIHVRRNTFPLVTSDWFLDRIVVERNRDSTKFIFKCHCWLRRQQPEITISSSSVSRSVERNNSSKDNQIILIILMVSISIIICVICFIRQCCRRRDATSVQIHQEPPIIDRYYSQLPTAPLLLHDTRDSWEDFRHIMPCVESTVITSIDEERPPPAYKDLFPD